MIDQPINIQHQYTRREEHQQRTGSPWMYLKRTMTLSNNFSSSSSDHSLFPDFSCTSTYLAGERRGEKERGREREGEGGKEMEKERGGKRRREGKREERVGSGEEGERETEGEGGGKKEGKREKRGEEGREGGERERERRKGERKKRKKEREEMEREEREKRRVKNCTHLFYPAVPTDKLCWFVLSPVNDILKRLSHDCLEALVAAECFRDDEVYLVLQLQ